MAKQKLMSLAMNSFQHDKKLQFGCVAQEDLLLATGHPKLQAFQRKLPGPTALRSGFLLHCALLSVFHPGLLLSTDDPQWHNFSSASLSTCW